MYKQTRIFIVNFLFKLFLFILLNHKQNEHQVEAFTNFLGEFFSDLKFGSIDSEYMRQKLRLKKLECLQGSYHFNGSCYFVSSKKYGLKSADQEVLIESLLKTFRKNKKLSDSLDDTPLGVASELATLPVYSTWNDAFTSCAKLNNESAMFLPANSNMVEFDFIVNLLKKLDFPNLIDAQSQASSANNQTAFMTTKGPTKFNQEKKYLIGLNYNNSQWYWSSGENLSVEFVKRFQLDKISYDSYRQCAYLNLRDNGDVKIEQINCNDGKQPYICKYVLDRCYNNTSCGPNGECINLPYKKSFECRCRLFYTGADCKKWSSQGVQMLITCGLVAFGISLVTLLKIVQKVRRKFNFGERRATVKSRVNRKGIDMAVLNPLLPQNNRYSVIQFKKNTVEFVKMIVKKKLRLLITITTSLTIALLLIFMVSMIRFRMIEYRIKRFNRKLETNNQTGTDLKDIDRNTTTERFTRIFSIDLCRAARDQFFEDYIIIYVSLCLTAIIYFWNSFKCNQNHHYLCQFYKFKVRKCNNNNNNNESSSSNESRSLEKIADELSSMERPSVLRRFCSWFSCRRLTFLGFRCACGVEFPVPMNPFSKRNRFITAVIYAAYTYNILKIFEFLLIGDQVMHKANNAMKSSEFLANFSLNKVSDKLTDIKETFADPGNGILLDLIKQVCSVLIIGLRYYPVLLCFNLKRKSKFSYFICTVYMLALFFYYIYMNIFCLLSAFEAVKEANEKQSNRFLDSVLDKIDSSVSSSADFFVPNVRMIQTGSNTSQANSSSAQSSTLSNYLKRSRQPTALDNGPVVYSPVPQFAHYNQNSRLSNTLDLVKNKTSSMGTRLDSDVRNASLSINESTFYSNIMYEKLIFYFVLCLICIHMTSEFFILIVRRLLAFKRRRDRRKAANNKRCCVCCKKNFGSVNSSAEHHDDDHDEDDDDDHDEQNGEGSDEDDDEEEVEEKHQVFHEINYTRQLLKMNQHPKTISFVKNFVETYIYKNRPDFRYSKQFINTNIIAFILLYYISCIIIRKSNQILGLSTNVLIHLFQFILKMNPLGSGSDLTSSKAQLTILIESLYSNINMFIVLACVFTTVIFVIQLLLGIRNYHNHVLNAYRGVYKDIPAPKYFSNTKLAANSLHYSGYAIGYLLWGYLLCFECMLIFIIIIRFLIKFYFITEQLAKVFLPILTIYLFKKLIIWYFCHVFLANRSSNSFQMRNPKLYYLLNHFNFFFDCFLGSFVCFMRMAKSSLAALVFMPRLDYSIYGRYLEKSDVGFTSYVAFIHMEVSQTHPVKLAFCQLARRSLKHRSPYRYNIHARNKWFVALTLSKNPFLKRDRKKFILLQSLIPKVETFEQFLQRRVKNIFLSDGKAKSKSTSCIVDEVNKSSTLVMMANNQLASNHGAAGDGTVTKRVRIAPPPVMPRTNFNYQNEPSAPPAQPFYVNDDMINEFRSFSNRLSKKYFY